MTNSFAIVFGLVIVAAFAADQFLGLGMTLFLSRKFIDLLHWVAFWR